MLTCFVLLSSQVQALEGTIYVYFKCIDGHTPCLFLNVLLPRKKLKNVCIATSSIDHLAFSDCEKEYVLHKY